MIETADKIRRRQRFKGVWLPAILVDPFNRCPHLHQRAIYGDEIRAAGWNRARCLDCGRLLPNLPCQFRVPGQLFACGMPINHDGSHGEGAM